MAIFEIVRLLLDKNADPNTEGKNGLTPLHVATHYSHVNVALLLLERDAKTHLPAKVMIDTSNINFLLIMMKNLKSLITVYTRS